MPTITLVTYINAPVEKVFDLARDLDMHQHSMLHTGEKAVAGRLSGLIEEGETVTWEARHFFKKRRLTSKIVSMRPPEYFRDEMIEGDFAYMAHDHHFLSEHGATLMKDVFSYKAPFHILGRLAEWLFLHRYLRKLLLQRNAVIRQRAESVE